jgi:hypothetical protein
MEDSDIYNQYYQELISINATISNFKQLFNGMYLDCQGEKLSFGQILCVDPESYTENNSLLYFAESDQSVEFNDGKPTFFSKYFILLSVGNKKNNVNDLVGPFQLSINTKEEIPNFHECVLFPDYFYIHPMRINFYDKRCERCPNQKCSILGNGIWCIACHGIMNASHLKYIMYKKVNFCSIPKSSILFIKKITWNINDNDYNSLLIVKNFLERDKEKIDIIKARIEHTEERIKRFINEA